MLLLLFFLFFVFDNNNNNSNNNNNNNNNNKMAVCCSCNGGNARCVRCVCVRSGRPCLNCRPKQCNNCHNTIPQRQSNLVTTPQNTGNTSSHLPSPPSSLPGPDNVSGVSQLHASSLVPSSSNPPDLNFDQYLMAAFGASLDHSEVPTAATSHDWVSRWSTIAHLRYFQVNFIFTNQ